jgi:hypothetical protein
MLTVDNISTVLVRSFLLTESKQLMLYEEKINSQEKENKSLQDTVSTLSREVYTLKSVVNNRRDDKTGATDSGKAVVQQIYDRTSNQFWLPLKPRELLQGVGLL